MDAHKLDDWFTPFMRIAGIQAAAAGLVLGIASTLYPMSPVPIGSGFPPPRPSLLGVSADVSFGILAVYLFFPIVAAAYAVVHDRQRWKRYAGLSVIAIIFVPLSHIAAFYILLAFELLTGLQLPTGLDFVLLINSWLLLIGGVLIWRNTSNSYSRLIGYSVIIAALFIGGLFGGLTVMNTGPLAEFQDHTWDGDWVTKEYEGPTLRSACLTMADKIHQQYCEGYAPTTIDPDDSTDADCANIRRRSSSSHSVPVNETDCPWTDRGGDILENILEQPLDESSTSYDQTVIIQIQGERYDCIAEGYLSPYCPAR